MGLTAGGEFSEILTFQLLEPLWCTHERCEESVLHRDEGLSVKAAAPCCVGTCVTAAVQETEAEERALSGAAKSKRRWVACVIRSFYLRQGLPVPTVAI